MLRKFFLSITLVLFGVVQAQFCAKDEITKHVQYGLGVCQVDWNKDGLLDFATGGYVRTKLQMHIQQKDGSYVTSDMEVENLASEHHALVTGDFNKDGNPDLLVGGRPLVCIFGDGKGGYIKSQMIHSDYLISLAVRDFDGDGNDDFLASIAAKQLSIFWGDGTGQFTEQVVDMFSDVYYFHAIAANLQTKDTHDIVMSIIFESKKGNTFAYINKGARVFQKLHINNNPCANIFSLFLNNDMQSNILQIDKNKVKIYSLQAPQKFTENSFYIRDYHISYAFTADINNDDQQDIVLVRYSGEIYILQNLGNGKFREGSTLAKIPAYIKDMDMLSFQNNQLRFLYNGSSYGIHTVYLPKMASWSQQYKNQPFALIDNDEARNNIMAFLGNIFLLESDQLELDVFAYTKSNNCEPFYGVFVEDHFYKFSPDGKLTFSTNKLHTHQRFEPNFSTTFEPCDFQQKLAINSAKREKGEGYNYACFMIDDFFQRFYSGLDFQHFDGKVKGIHFEYKAERTTENQKKQEVYLGFQAGEVTWTHWCSDIQRAAENRPALSIVQKENAAQKIQKFIQARYTEEQYQKADIFFRERFSYYGDRFLEKHGNSFRYGVFIYGKLYLFDMDGNNL